MSGNDWVIRNLEAADIPAADQVLVLAFDRPQSRAAELAAYLKLQPDGWFIGLLDGAAAAVVGAVDYGPFAYVGLMGVHPACQGRGLGRVMMTHLLAWLDGRGTPAVLLDATDKGFPLYASLGFVPHDLARVFVQEQPGLLPPPPDFVQPLERSCLDELVAFDTLVFGADRRRVFEMLFDGGRPAFLARQAGRLCGYLFLQEQRLGPWVAETGQVAEGLLQAALSTPQGCLVWPLSTSLPGANPVAEAVLGRYGFYSPRHIRHMRRGRLVTPEQRAWVYGQASFAIG